MTDTSDKLRSLFLTLLMVMSVFAMTVGFAGTAAAANTTVNSAVSFKDTDSSNVLIELELNKSIDQTTLSVNNDFNFYLNNGTEVTPSTATVDSPSQVAGGTNDAQVVLNLTTSVSAAQFDKVEVTSNAPSALVRGNTSVTATSKTVAEAQANTTAYKGEKIAVVGDQLNEEIEVQDNAGGFYFDGSTGSGSQVHVFDTAGRDTGPKYLFLFNGNSTVDFSGDVSVQLRSLGLSVSATDTSLTTNDANIKADVSANAGNRQVRAELIFEGNDTVKTTKTVNLGGNAQTTVSFSNPGEADYRINVTDIATGIEVQTKTISVKKVTGDASFGASVFTEERGDVANITININNADSAKVFVGSTSINYLQELTVTDDADGQDNDDVVHLLINTYKVRESGSTNSAITVADEDDSVTVDKAHENVSAPLGSGSYNLNASVGGSETGVATLELVDRSTDRATTWIAPRGKSVSTRSGIVKHAVQQSSTALKDKVIIQVEASGIYGFFNTSYDLNSSGPQPGSVDAGTYGAYMTIKQTKASTGSNQARNVINASNVSLVIDAANNTFYAVIDTSKSSKFSGLAKGQTYDATFVLNETSPFVDDATANVEDKESVSTTFTLKERTATINNLNQSNYLRVGPNSGVTVTGTSTVAPGTNLSVRIKSTTSGRSYLLTATERTVQSDGTWSATFDFTGRSGTTFTIDVREGGTTLQSRSGVVLSEATASVTFNDQESPDGAVVTVASVTLSRGGFVAIHAGSASGDIIGTSKFLSAGTHKNVRISLDDPINESMTLVAMPHLDENGDNVFSAMTDGAYTSAGAPVTDSASVSPQAAQVVTKTIVKESPTPIIVTRTVKAQSPTPREVTRTVVKTKVQQKTVVRTVVKTQTPGQPGFGLAIAVVALLAAALLAVRRRS